MFIYNDDAANLASHILCKHSLRVLTSVLYKAELPSSAAGTQVVGVVVPSFLLIIGEHDSYSFVYLSLILNPFSVRREKERETELLLLLVS